MNDVTLPQPIKVNGKTVKFIKLAEPTAGQMRGLMLSNVLQMETGTIIKLAPRITTPVLTEADVAALSPRNFAAVALGIVTLFIDPAEAASLGQA
ncbi:MAG: phage tail assembly protein [Pseudomonadota bacterium]